MFQLVLCESVPCLIIGRWCHSSRRRVWGLLHQDVMWNGFTGIREGLPCCEDSYLRPGEDFSRSDVAAISLALARSESWINCNLPPHLSSQKNSLGRVGENLAFFLIEIIETFFAKLGLLRQTLCLIKLDPRMFRFEDEQAVYLIYEFTTSIQEIIALIAPRS